MYVYLVQVQEHIIKNGSAVNFDIVGLDKVKFSTSSGLLFEEEHLFLQSINEEV